MKVSAVAECSTSQEPAYVLVPISSLPTIDLSKSVGAELLPQRLDAFIFYSVERFNKALMLASVVSLCMNIAVVVVTESTGQCLSLISLVLGLSIIIGGICTLRFDIVRLALRTFEFWSFFVILSLTSIMYAAFVGDLRIPRILLDWCACLEAVFLDAQVHNLRNHVIGIVVAIAPVSVMLIWSMLGRIYGGTSFTILTYENHNGHFNLSTLDIMGNGLVTLILLFIKIGYRKRQVLRSDFSGTRVDCAILRVGLKMELIPTQSGRRQSRIYSSMKSCQAVGAGPLSVRPRIIQKVTSVDINTVFVSNYVIFPIKSTAHVQISVTVLILIYAVGITGLLLSLMVIVSEWSPAAAITSSTPQVQTYSWISLACTIAFVTPFAALYHRELLRMLIFSFDFAFYSFQITSSNVCVASLYRWNSSHNIAMVVWWIWAHWALTIEALTPVMRKKLCLRLFYAGPVIALVLIIHVTIVSGIFFMQNVNLPDVIIWEGTVWRHYVKVSVLPYYFSRVVTLLLWCLRLVWRLSKASDGDMALIRAAASYESCFVNVEPPHALQSLAPSSSRLVSVAPYNPPAGPAL
ncbi:unnamed protein product [Phytophthora fragariaefolia]|uniref:Unnamed protein product n=1 Tax=Phytophthora fragariaefolia TaxID=1490495 RepID=A0A9W6WYK7_9STRA|nr:unnamed protein product [Phytophthora fragariaefolia]